MKFRIIKFNEEGVNKLIYKYIKNYFDFIGLRKIALYGMGQYGTILYNELMNLDKDYVIECYDEFKDKYNNPNVLKNANEKYFVIVTIKDGYDEIERKLQEFGYREIIDYICIGKFIDVVKRPLSDEYYGLYGDFTIWNEANMYLLNEEQYSQGYNENNILEQVFLAVKNVRSGNACFERDGYLFYIKDYNYNLLSALFYIISHEQKIDVLDFGGSLGSTYFQNRELLNDLNCRWSIVEQKSFVECGKKNIPEIEFYYNVDDYVNSRKIVDTILLSGSLQYLDSPYKYLKKFLSYKFKYIIFDRMIFNIENKDRLCIQMVSPEIYDAKYPVWLLSENRVKDIILSNGYEIIFEWVNDEKTPLKHNQEEIVYCPYKGALLKLRE